VIVYRFGHDDLLRTRFAISPLMELSGSVEALREPEKYSIHGPWLEWAAPRITGLQWDLLDAVIPYSDRWFPDFVTPPPREPQAQLEPELRRVLSTDWGQLAAELHHAYPDGVPAPARVLLDDPAAGLQRLVRQMRAWWDALLAPWWDQILAFLHMEIAERGRRLADVGPAAAFEDVSDTVRWTGRALEIEHRAVGDVDLAGRGLLLVPAAFAWPVVWPLSDPPWQPSLVYAPRGVAELWAPPSTCHGALEELLGARRARILLALPRPASTQELAGRLRASPASVSEHLGVLRDAGLVAGRRAGRHVLYTRTRAGDVLVRASTR
jgi:DNA-binding transcriptional ArsR family regulator